MPILPTIKQKPITKKQNPYILILHNDDDHTVDYVVNMCMSVFNHTQEKGVQVAQEVHFTGRSILFSGSLEVAELKQEQVNAFGPDPLIPHCKGPMTTTIEQT